MVEIVALGVLGLLLGSVLGVGAHRLLLRRRPRDSGAAAISVPRPLSGIALAAAFVGVNLRFEGSPWAIALGCVFAATLLVVTLTDLEERIIPNEVLITSLLGGAALILAGGLGGWDERLIAAGVSFGVLLAVALLHPGGMGMGDVKLAGLMGVYLGKWVAPALLAGFLFGALYGVALMARHGPEARKEAVPFGPFLAAGGLVGLFAGEEIVDAYTDSFFA